MMDKNMNNYIGKVDAEWVDPKVELPPDGWCGMCKSGSVSLFYARWVGRKWTDQDLLFRDPTAWLRIGGPSTAIPRERVQAAVDHLYECEAQADGGGDWAFREALDSIDHHTGITPSEVPHD